MLNDNNNNNFFHYDVENNVTNNTNHVRCEGEFNLHASLVSEVNQNIKQ